MPKLPPLPRLLVVDDHKCVARALAKWLARTHWVLEPVFVLGFLDVALWLGRPVIVLLDLEMGSESSIGQIRRLVRDFPGTRFVVCTAHDDALTREVCLREGAHGFVSKSDDWGELTATINRVLRTLPPHPPAPIGPVPEVLRRGPDHGIRHHDHGRLVAWMLASGIRRVEIADRLGLSVKTVGYHARKLASGNPEEVVSAARLIR
jgi:DNA-binding NarL/FixJ family response regulator